MTDSTTAVNTVKVEEKVLSKNDMQAKKNRELFAQRNIFALNIISSPGSGKTTLLQKTLDLVSNEIACAVVTGDQSTDNDARRLAGRGAPVAQILTGNSCHLDALRVADSLPSVLQPQTRLLFIENVGNLICPAAFDLGEHIKVTLLSVTEGEDKPVKYPSIFSKSDAVVLTKIDLVEHLDWSRDYCIECLSKAAPRAAIFEVSAKTGTGMEQWKQFLLTQVRGLGKNAASASAED